MAGEPADAFYQKEISPNGPEVRLEEMRCYGAHCSLFDLLEPRFWIVSEQVPTIRELSWLTLTFYRKRSMLT
jgi:hypothetical protein